MAANLNEVTVSGKKMREYPHISPQVIPATVTIMWWVSVLFVTVIHLQFGQPSSLIYMWYLLLQVD